ncbi:MAG: hypothetical protein WD042_02035 [Phycisphaeraceae bacterium]
MADYLATAIFPTHVGAAEAVNRLEAIGISAERISVLMSDSLGEDFKLQTKSKLSEGVATGATAGGALGALVAGLTAVGVIASGGTGLLIAGPVVAALAGAGAGAAAGSVLGGLVGYGFTDHEAKLFAKELEDGKVLVAVECRDSEQRKQVFTTLKQAGAESTARA